MLWLGVEAPGLAELHAAVAAEWRAAGGTPEARPFAPHLTLGRIDRLKNARGFPETLRAVPTNELPAQAVRELILYESAAGRYVPLARWPLRPRSRFCWPGGGPPPRRAAIIAAIQADFGQFFGQRALGLFR